MMHRFASPLAAIPVALLTVLPGFAMNNADLLKLQEAGLSEDTILLSMTKEPADYDSSPGALVQLKEAGVSEKIIQKLISLGSGDDVAAPAPVPASSAPAAIASDGSDAGATSSLPARDEQSAAADMFAQEFPSIAPPFVDPVIGQDYFTRYSLHEERHEYPTTNYARGNLVPINTPVKLLAMKKDKLLLRRLDSGTELGVENVEKYSRKSLGEVARLLLSAEKTPLEKFPSDVASAIRNGEMRKGMTREQVLMARGYPPAHETPMIDGDRWVYWSSRFVKQTIVFGNGRLIEGRGIY